MSALGNNVSIAARERTFAKYFFEDFGIATQPHTLALDVEVAYHNALNSLSAPELRSNIQMYQFGDWCNFQLF